MGRADSLGKTLTLGKAEGESSKRWRRMRCLDSVVNSMDLNLSELWDAVKDGGAWRAIVHGVAESQTWLSE